MPMSRKEFLLGGTAAIATIGADLTLPPPLPDVIGVSAKPIPPDDVDGKTKTPPRLTTEVWTIPTTQERIKLLSDPEFFTQPRYPGSKILLSPQFVNAEWETLDPKWSTHIEQLKNNACGPAVISTVVKTMEYLCTGKVPNTTCADVVNYLTGDHQGYRMALPSGIAMQDLQLYWSLELYSQQTGWFSPIWLTPNWGLNNTHNLPESEWKTLFCKAKAEVLNRGGLVVARILKYGKVPGTAGHFIAISNFNASDEPLIIDSYGPYINGTRQGDARTLALASYTEKINHSGTVWEGQPGLFSMIGVIPTF